MSLPETILKEIAEKTGWERKEVQQIYEGMGKAIQEASLVHPHNIVHVALIRGLTQGPEREIRYELAKEMLECFACSSFLMVYPEIRDRLWQIVKSEEKKEQPAEAVDPERAFFMKLRDAAKNNQEGVVEVKGVRGPNDFLAKLSEHGKIRVLEKGETLQVEYAQAAAGREGKAQFVVEFSEFLVKVTWDPLKDPRRVRFRKYPKSEQRDK